MLWRFTPLEFESGVFGAPVGRVAPDPEGAELATLTTGWLVSARIDADDQGAARELSDAGFKAIETLVTLQRPLSGSLPVPDGVRLAIGEDTDACLAIARRAFVHDRFHADARVPDAGADLLKETWVRNSLSGRADAVLVAQVDGQVAGFVTCMVNSDAAVIDLIAVGPSCQGQGIGTRLVQGALAHYTGRKALMRVGTQDTNTHSLALYEGQGFTRAHAQVTYHWINEGAGIDEGAGP